MKYVSKAAQWVGFGLSLGATPILCLLHGAVFMQLWAWFVMPFFRQPALTLPIAIGLVLIGGFFTHKSTPPREYDGDRDFLEAIVAPIIDGFLHSLVVLACGWVVARFIG